VLSQVATCRVVLPDELAAETAFCLPNAVDASGVSRKESPLRCETDVDSNAMQQMRMFERPRCQIAQA
jgi:hypothetical protein